MSDEAVTLYRPVGQSELDLIRTSGFVRFPPRLPDQPIFYPVTSEAYATKIARDWNTKDERSGFVGYVLSFKVNRSILANYQIQENLSPCKVPRRLSVVRLFLQYSACHCSR